MLTNVDPTKYKSFTNGTDQGIDSEVARTQIGTGSESDKSARNVSNFLNNMPGMHWIPQVLGDIYDTKRGIFDKESGFGERNPVTGDWVTKENPFRSEEQLVETRNRDNPLGFGADVAKEVAGIASMYGGALPSKLAGLKGFQALARPHPILEALGRLTLGGGITGTAAGLGTEKPTPTSVISTAAIYAALAPLLGLIGGKKLTTRGLWKQIEGETGKATQAGHKVSLRDIDTAAKESLRRYEGTNYTGVNAKEYQQAIHKTIDSARPGERIATGLPGGQMHSTQLTPKEILRWSNELSKQAKNAWVRGPIGSTFNPQASINAKVGEAYRSAAANQLKDLSPSINLNYGLHRLYSNPLVGSPAQLPLRVAGLGLGGTALGVLANKVIGGITGR